MELVTKVLVLILFSNYPIIEKMAEGTMILLFGACGKHIFSLKSFDGIILWLPDPEQNYVIHIFKMQYLNDMVTFPQPYRCDIYENSRIYFPIISKILVPIHSKQKRYPV